MRPRCVSNPKTTAHTSTATKTCRILFLLLFFYLQSPFMLLISLLLILVKNWPMKNAKPAPSILRILARKPINDHLFEIQLEKPTAENFKEGQSIGFKVDGLLRLYSVASSSNASKIELCVRRLQDGKVSPKLCGNFTKIEFAGFFGNELTLNPNLKPEKFVFIATGTGVAPFRAHLMKFSETPKHFPEIDFFIGARNSEEIPFKDDFLELSHWNSLKLHFAFSREPGKKKVYVQEIIPADLDLKNSVVMVCGSKDMGQAVRGLLRQRLGEEEFQKKRKEKSIKIEVY